MKRTYRFVLLCLGSALLLAGCGASSKPAAPAYVAQANAICRSAHAQLGRMQRPTTPAQAVYYLPPALAIMHREASALSTVSAPAAERAKLAAAVGNLHRFEALLEHALRELHSGLMIEFATIAAIQGESAAAHARTDASFRVAGVTACAS